MWHARRKLDDLRLGLKELLLTKLNVLLVAVPLAFVASSMRGSVGDVPVFILALLALCPLAERLGFLTEQLASTTSDCIAGLMNASLGNVPELITALVAIANREPDIAVDAVAGSVVSDTLLVLGLSLLVGGIRRATLSYSTLMATSYAKLLMVPAVAFLLQLAIRLPKTTTTTTTHNNNITTPVHAPLSEATSTHLIAGVLLIAYVLFLWFQLNTHAELFEDGDETTGGDDDGGMGTADSVAETEEDGAAAKEVKESLASAGEEAVASAADDHDESVMDAVPAFVYMVIVTILIAFMSDFVVDTISAVAVEWQMSSDFLAAIVQPNVGNAPEHAVAILLAWNNKMNLVLGVCIGAAVQNACFILPVAQLVGWGCQVELVVSSNTLLTASFFMTAVAYALVAISGKLTWSHGVALICMYVVVAIAFLGEPIGDQDGPAAAFHFRRAFNYRDVGPPFHPAPHNEWLRPAIAAHESQVQLSLQAS
jgi:Ca2+:H+ antiporter